MTKLIVHFKTKCNILMMTKSAVVLMISSILLASRCRSSSWSVVNVLLSWGLNTSIFLINFNELVFKRREIFMNYPKQMNVLIYQKNKVIIFLFDPVHIIILFIDIILHTSASFTPPHCLHSGLIKTFNYYFNSGSRRGTTPGN